MPPKGGCGYAFVGVASGDGVAWRQVRRWGVSEERGDWGTRRAAVGNASCNAPPVGAGKEHAGGVEGLEGPVGGGELGDGLPDGGREGRVGLMQIYCCL